MLTLTIPAPCEPLNANDRPNRYAKAARIKQWRARGHVAAIQAGKPRLDRAHVTYTIHATSNRRRDVANYYGTVKAILDGIVDAGVLDDDSDRYVVGPDPEPGEKRDVFTVVVELDPDCTCRRCAHRFGPRLSLITNGDTA